jgi:hypothetical protein
LNSSSPKKRTAFSREKKDKRETSSQIHFLLLTTTQKTEERRGVEAEGVKNNGWILDDFLATRTDRGVVVRFGRDWSGVTGVRPTD